MADTSRHQPARPAPGTPEYNRKTRATLATIFVGIPAAIYLFGGLLELWPFQPWYW